MLQKTTLNKLLRGHKLKLSSKLMFARASVIITSMITPEEYLGSYQTSMIEFCPILING